MFNINKIYKKEKVLNANFKKRYDYFNSEIFYKQVLQLNIEISELAYETKCFKFWKSDLPSDKETILYEFADCLMITLGFCDLKNIDISNIPKINESDLIQIFIKLHQLCSKIELTSKDLYIDILSYLILIPEILKFSDIDVEIYCLKKMDNVLELIKNNFNIGNKK